jgi:hypothetical protein
VRARRAVLGAIGHAWRTAEPSEIVVRIRGRFAEDAVIADADLTRVARGW